MPIVHATDADFESALRSSERTIVKYHADWCGSCQLLAPHFQHLSGRSRLSAFLFLEVNAEENPKARKLAGLHDLPFMAVFSGVALKKSARIRTAKEMEQFMADVA